MISYPYLPLKMKLHKYVHRDYCFDFFLVRAVLSQEALKKYFLKKCILNGEKPQRLLQRNETTSSLFMKAQATDL